MKHGLLTTNNGILMLNMRQLQNRCAKHNRCTVSCALAIVFIIANCGLASFSFANPIRNPVAIFKGLDKITGRVVAFEVLIDETVQFGSLLLTPRTCNTRPETETPNTTAFLEVDELGANSKADRLFTGWVFAASPGLHGIEHPVYDIWLTDCRGGTLKASSSSSDSTEAVLSSSPPPPPPRYLLEENSSTHWDDYPPSTEYLEETGGDMLPRDPLFSPLVD